MAKKKPIAINAGATNKKPAPSKKGFSYAASILCDGPIPKHFVDCVGSIEQELGKPVWLLVHDGDNKPTREIDSHLTEAFVASKQKMPSVPIALLIDSPGGYANEAFRIAMVLRRRCTEFTVVVPRYAKSAATLLSLGASEIYLGEDAELGPLDVQITEHDSEEQFSALDEVQAVQELEHSTIESAITALQFMSIKLRKRKKTLLPEVFQFVAETTRPLFEKIDAVRFTRMSRLLRVGEEYAVRLLQPRFSESDARLIASELVNSYPEHGFPVNNEEIHFIERTKGVSDLVVSLNDPRYTPNLRTAVASIRPMLKQRVNMIGRIEEVPIQ